MRITSDREVRSDKYFLNSGNFLKVDLAFHCKIVIAIILRIFSSVQHLVVDQFYHQLPLLF